MGIEIELNNYWVLDTVSSESEHNIETLVAI